MIHFFIFSSTDTITNGLQNKFNIEDEKNILSYGFPNDTPELPLNEFHNITAVLTDKFEPPKHFKSKGSQICVLFICSVMMLD
jgi:hypothetical protein